MNKNKNRNIKRKNKIIILNQKNKIKGIKIWNSKKIKNNKRVKKFNNILGRMKKIVIFKIL
jgi:hypothetical protein